MASRILQQSIIPVSMRTNPQTAFPAEAFPREEIDNIAVLDVLQTTLEGEIPHKYARRSNRYCRGRKASRIGGTIADILQRVPWYHHRTMLTEAHNFGRGERGVWPFLKIA